jgi:hypothetical protein
MNTCGNCPMPRRCLSAERCIVYKEGAEPVVLPEPKPVPVKTSFGVGSTGKKAKKGAKK